MAEGTARWAAPQSPAPAATTPPPPGPPPAAPPPQGRGGNRPIPLRPMTVLELIDGAAGAVRAIPVPVLRLGAAVVSAAALAGFGLDWGFARIIGAGLRGHPLVVFDYAGNATVEPGRTSGSAGFAIFAVRVLIPVTCSGFGATVLAGLSARPVRQFVDGAAADTAPGPATPGPRGAIARLCAIAAVSALPRLLLTLAATLVALIAVNDPQGDYAFFNALLILAGFPFCFWTTAQWAVGAPAAVLEDTGTRAALARAHRLVAGGRWRTSWTALLTFTIAFLATGSLSLVQRYLADRHGIDRFLFGDSAAGGATYGWLAAYLVLLLLVQLLTSPLRANAATMLYIDRRFRREGLDIRIAWARAARQQGAGGGR